MTFYAECGVPTVINAAGTLTRLGGGPMRAEVSEAMTAAAQSSVDLVSLQAHASEVIAGITGAEAGIVTAGASAGLLLSAAACLTGLDPARMSRLPDTAGMAKEIIVARDHRNGYDHALRAAGARFVEVGLPDRSAKAGLRGTESWEIAAAFNERTVAVFYVAGCDSGPALAGVVDIAHAHSVPVIVDAAAQLPPQSNLVRFIEEGADLVAFSGGKAIGGPQASGILCGTRDLIMAAALQQMDLDVIDELWEPSAVLIDRNRLAGVPRHGIGRSCKVGKEEIAGLLTALQLFVAEGDENRHARWLADSRILASGLAAAKIEVSLLGADTVEAIPKAALQFPRGRESAAIDLIRALQDGEPSIAVDATDHSRGIVVFNPICLKPGEAETIVRTVLQWMLDRP